MGAGCAVRLATALTAAAACLPLLACDPTEIRVRTEFAPDGSSTRELLYVFPEKKEDGKETGEAQVPERLVVPARERWPHFEFEGTRLVARGFFPRPADIPSAYGWRGRREGRVLDSSVSFRADDFVLFERYRYAERFRPPVDRDEMEKSISEAVEVAAALLVEALREILGAHFDLAQAEAWIRDEGVRTMRALVQIWWEEMREEGGERLSRRIAARLARAGLEVSAEDLDGDAAPEKDCKALARRLAPLLRPPQAQPASSRRAAPIPASAVENLLDEDRLQEALEAAAEKKFGSKEASDKWFGDRFNDLAGEFGGPDSKDLRFDVTVVMPGEALRTNGVLLAPNEILWRFLSGDLFPGGTLLEAESLSIRHDRLGLLSKWKGSLDRRDVLDLLDILATEAGPPKGDLVQALRAGFVRGGTPATLLEPLREKNEDAAKALEAVLVGGKPK
jgi:hypothetical protein